jgi:8-oxo-dGTP pyrophosphatase MutT (NUDIX family)
MKSLSCGILVLNPRAELLLCHVTGAWHWDIPKGSAEPGEAPLAAALRETREECGLDFADRPLLDLGRMAYQSHKNLHLFGALTEPFDVAVCRCDSHYTDGWGRNRPEMDGFEWVPFDRVHRRCARHMAALLGGALSLPGLLARLQGGAPAGPAGAA